VSPEIRAILWAQWRSLLNHYPKSNKTSLAFTSGLAAVWYGGWGLLALFAARVFADPANAGLPRTVLPSALLFVFLYWQVVPILLVSTGVSLSTRKLQAYPVPSSQLFLIEILLRITTSAEMMIMMAGLAVGLFANPKLPKWGALAVLTFCAFNLCVSAGARELMVRLFERKRIREIAVLLLVMLGALPQFLIATGTERKLQPLFRATALPLWPWSAAARLASGTFDPAALAALVIWTLAAYAFGRWQFERTLRFDADESNATLRDGRRPSSLLDAVPRWPSILFSDPLAAIIEKEIRFLSRTPRFRLVFAMGFTFGLVIWLPMAIGRGPGHVFAANYLTFTCLYALLLLGDTCFWNVFGFDRSAAQVYWAMPVRLATVLAGKNISAIFFVLIETTIVTTICAVLRLPITRLRVLEAYGVTLVVALYLISLGNLTSTSNARPINPAKAMRTGSPGRLQALLFVLYPVAAAPVLLAYAARYAFDSELAYFVVLGITALFGVAVYWVSLDSAVQAAERNKEKLLAALAEGEGVMQG
jgi:ABC-2 type transport system permease protein